MKATIAIDIGGTQMRAAAYPIDSLEPLKVNRIPTQGTRLSPEERLSKLIESVWPEKADVLAIGAAAPGPLNPATGVVLSAPNIPKWENFELQQYIEKKFNTPAQIGNDANLAALGEWKFGAGRGHHHLIYLTISTGIGGGVIVDDRLLVGANGLAGELGHVTVSPGGPYCSCGRRGHLEAVASGPSIVRWVKEELERGMPSKLLSAKPLTPKKIAQAAHEGDELAQAAFERAGTFIGRAIVDFLHIFNPTAVIIGGGVSQVGELLFAPIREALPQYVFGPKYLEDLQILKAALGDDVGLMGALALTRDMLST